MFKHFNAIVDDALGIGEKHAGKPIDLHGKGTRFWDKFFGGTATPKGLG